MADGVPAELDLWRAAQQMIRRYGAEAEVQTTDMLMRALDDQAKDVWLSILGKVRALQVGIVRTWGRSINTFQRMEPAWGHCVRH